MRVPLRKLLSSCLAVAALLLLAPTSFAAGVELRDVRLWDGPESTRVVLDLEGGTEHNAFGLSNPNRLVIDIRNAHKSPALKLNGLAKGVVKAVRSGVRDDGIRIVFDLAEEVSANGFGLEPNGDYGYRLVFDLTPQKRGAAVQSASAASKSTVTPAAPVAAAAASAPPVPRPVAPPPEPAPRVSAPAIIITPALPTLTVLPPAQKAVIPRAVAVVEEARPKPKPRAEEPFINLPVPQNAVAAPASPPPAAASNSALARAEPTYSARSEPRAGRTAREIVIAIDAGHGGIDPGASGVHGTLEKDVCLQIARRLARLIDATPGYRAAMTRNSDVYLPLRQRSLLARRAQADLFISLHANSMPVSSSIHGTAIYVLSERGASSEHAKMLANLENSADLIGGVPLKTQDDDLASVLLDISQTAVREASFDVASRLLSSIGSAFPLQKNEPQQAGLAVLKSPDMPSVLVETAFLSDERDERMLSDPEHQQAIAESLMRGVRSYFSAYRPQPQVVNYEPDFQRRPARRSKFKRKKKI